MLGNTYFISMMSSRCCNEVFQSNRVNIGNRNSSKFNFVVSLIGLGAVCGFGFGLTKKYPAIKNASSSLYQNCLRYLFPVRPQLFCAAGAACKNNESSTPSSSPRTSSDLDEFADEAKEFLDEAMYDGNCAKRDLLRNGKDCVSASTNLPLATLETSYKGGVHLGKPQEDLRTPLEIALSEWVQKSSSFEEKAIRLENQKSISDAYRSNTLYLKGDLTQLPSIVWQQPFIQRLESLKLLRCNLASIPQEIALAKDLKYFTIEGSKLSEFPAGLISKLDKLTLFQVKNNLDVEKVDFYKDRSILENPRRGDSLSVGWNQQNAAYVYKEGARVAIHA